jgi:hypothetical protein
VSVAGILLPRQQKPAKAGFFFAKQGLIRSLKALFSKKQIFAQQRFLLLPPLNGSMPRSGSNLLPENRSTQTKFEGPVLAKNKSLRSKGFCCYHPSMDQCHEVAVICYPKTDQPKRSLKALF